MPLRSVTLPMLASLRGGVCADYDGGGVPPPEAGGAGGGGVMGGVQSSRRSGFATGGGLAQHQGGRRRLRTGRRPQHALTTVEAGHHVPAGEAPVGPGHGGIERLAGKMIALPSGRRKNGPAADG